MGLVLPISSMAALLASLPKIASWASMTCHCRIMPFLEGNSVLIDPRLQLILKAAKYLAYGERGYIVKSGDNDPALFLMLPKPGLSRLRVVTMPCGATPVSACQVHFLPKKAE